MAEGEQIWVVKKGFLCFCAVWEMSVWCVNQALGNGFLISYRKQEFMECKSGHSDTQDELKEYIPQFSCYLWGDG